MKYRKIDAKYEVEEPESRQTSIYGYDIDTHRIRLTPKGVMTLKKHFTWNGASGPTFDTLSTITPSGFHDAGYELIEEGLLPPSYKEYFDGLLYFDLIQKSDIIIKREAEKLPKISRPVYIAFRKRAAENRALAWYNAVIALGGNSCIPGNINPILEAP